MIPSTDNPVTTLPVPFPGSTLITHNFWETAKQTRVIGKRIGQLIIPALGVISSNTLGIANQAAKLNYAAKHNFTIQLSSIPPQAPGNYNLVLRYTDPISGAVIRYKLWDIDPYPANDVPCPVYAGQPIYGASFSVEVWSTFANTVCGVLNSLTLNTSNLKARCALNDADTFSIATASECGNLFATNVYIPEPANPSYAVSTHIANTTPNQIILTINSTGGSVPTQGQYVTISGDTIWPAINGTWQIASITGLGPYVLTFDIPYTGNNFSLADTKANLSSLTSGGWTLPLIFAACAAS